MGDAMLEVSRLVAGYGGAPVGRLAALRVEAGEAVVLTGTSAAGKTTLLLALAGLAPTLEGTVAIDGEGVTRLPPTRCRQPAAGAGPPGRHERSSGAS